MITPEVKTTIRALGIALGTFLIQRGYLQEHQLEMFSGGIVALSSFVLELIDAWRNKKVHENVMEIQQTLNDKIPNIWIKEDGVLGEETKKAIKEVIK